MSEWNDGATPDAVRDASDGIRRIIDNVRSIISISGSKIEHLLAAKLAGGHVILADSHGVGKTSLAKALAASIRWHTSGTAGHGVDIDHFSRIQCTVDLLPQDILGFNRYDIASGAFTFTRGPLFAHFVLCDEINLLTPKTQGSFLQAMEEQAVTVEGTTYGLPDPFFIIATMNLKGAHLFPLPVPQLDRFMVQLSMGYPSSTDEERIVRQHGREDAWDQLEPVVSCDELVAWQRLVDRVYIHDELIAYLVECVRLTRQHPAVETGASPRTGVKLSRLARALALVRGQEFVTIDLAKEVLIPGVSHRLLLEDSTGDARAVIDEVRSTVRVDRLPVRAG